MAGRISDADIQALRERADIATVVGTYTALKPAGRRLKGLCPFHSERTPSFTVDRERGYFHCFGCGVGGDVYGFVQQMEALSFPEAVERLARLVGYDLRYEELSPGQRRALGKRTRLVEAIAEAQRFYAGCLAAEEGGPARDYLASRGVDEVAIEAFGLGWAPDAWDALGRHLQQQGFGPEEVVEAGLATQGQRGTIDRFRGRVVFPIYERSGRDVVAFGGRVVPGLALRTGPRDGEPPKYINSSESPVYRKSEVLYALNWARAEAQRRDEVLVVEGYMDVLGLHLAGVRHAVATCGTALTVEHLAQLEKFARRVVLALDADTAGFAAADRARALAEEAGIGEVAVLPLPPGQDPADLAASGRAAVDAALASTRTAVEFQIDHLLRSARTDTPEGQAAAYRATFPLLARIEDRFLRYRYIRDLVAPVVRLSADVIEAELDAALPTTEGAGGSAVPAAPASPIPLGAGTGPHDAQVLLEREVLRAALQQPELLPAEWAEVTDDDFTTDPSRQLLGALRRARAGDLDAVLAALPDDGVRGRVRALAMSDSTVGAEPAKVAEVVARLRAATLARRLVDVRERLARQNEQLDPDERRRLGTQLFELERRRRALLEKVDR